MKPLRSLGDCFFSRMTRFLWPLPAAALICLSFLTHSIIVQAEIIPQLIGTWKAQPPEDLQDVVISSNYAYVVSSSGLIILDLSNPVAPIRMGTVGAFSRARDVAVANNYVYVIDQDSELQIIDVTNPAAPVRVGSVSGFRTAAGVTASGNYAYLADSTYGLKIIDAANPTKPVVVGGYFTFGDARKVAISGNYVYLADWSSGLHIVDVSNPKAPIRTGGDDNSFFNAVDIAVSGHYAYVADWGRGLLIFDVSNPQAPTRVGWLDNGMWETWSVIVSGDFAYVANEQWAGFVLDIIDVSNPLLPSRVGAYVIESPFNFAVSGNYAYVAAGSSGLAIVRLSSSPQLQVRLEQRQIRLSWTISITDFVLQSSSALDPNSNWSDVNASIERVGEKWTVAVKPEFAARFYRLLSKLAP